MGCKILAALSAFSIESAFAAPTIYEAEDQPGVSAADISVGSDGAKYVKPDDATAGMTFNVKVKETAVYDITTKVLIKQYAWFNSNIVVNGAEAGSLLTKPVTCDSAFVITASAKMRAGENSITVGNGGALGVDYITVERHPDAVFKISELPVTPNATESARKVYTFLRDNFGKKTVSGMMISDQNFNYDYGNMRLIPPGGCTPADSCKFSDEEVSWKGQTDIAEFYKRSGHYPAIGGFDMLFAAGGHHEEGWFKGYTENNLVMTEQLWEMGGIPTYTWHWKVGEDTVFYTQGTPAGFNNPGCTEDVMGTSETNTCFNYTKAFKGDKCQDIDETSQEYKDIVADVDIVSGYFKQLEEKGIAVVWRPLHEASGGWFWWGTASAECYVQLYRLVFNRMVVTNELKNLIWVWNINTDPKFGYDYSALNAAWYPGDEYVDIVAVDIYNPMDDHNSGANYFNKIVSDVGTNKMIALSENGAIPDIDSIAEDKAYWSYWMTWSQTWSGNFLEKTPTDMWKRNLDDERIIALDDMPGWDNVKADIRMARRIGSNNLAVNMQGKQITVSITHAGTASIALFDMLGHKVASLAQGNLPAGTTAFNLDGIASGHYIVRAKVGSTSLAKKISIK